MGILVLVAIFAIPIACLWVVLRIRQLRHPGGGYGGRYDSAGRMSLMTYAQISAMTAQHGSPREAAGEAFTESAVADTGPSDTVES
jgi:hypothetical protein